MKSKAGLEALLDLWDKETGSGRDEAGAREVASSYLAEHPEQFADLEGRSVEDLVGLVDYYRETAEVARRRGLDSEAANADVKKLLVDVYLLATVPKRHVGGIIGDQTVGAI